MAKGWMSVALTASWLGACASVVAQPLPAPVAGALSQYAPEVPPPPVPVEAGGPCLPGPEPVCPDVPCAKLEEPCDQGPHYHVGCEYLLWYTRKQNLPALVTAGAFSDPIPAALGQPHTRVLLSGSDIDQNQHSGARLTFGIGLDSNPNWSVDGSAFLLGTRTGSRAFAGDGAAGSSALGRPFFNVNAGVEDADPVALPNIASGTVQIDTTRQLYGADLNLRYHQWGDQTSRFVFLLGGRFLELDEALRIHETSQDLPGLGAPGNSYFLSEEFNARNRFAGGQAGAEYEFHVGPVFVNAVGKVAFGAVQQNIRNSAFTTIVEPSGIVTSSSNSALYISPNNAGSFSRTRFAVVPEGNVKVGIDFNQYVRLTVGYTFLYLSDAARPGAQVDRNVNVQPVGAPFVIPPAAAPPSIQSTGFWAQGFDVGLRFSF